MLRIRKLTDTHSPANRVTLQEAKEIVRAQFPGILPEDVARLTDEIDNPMRYDLVSELLVAEDDDSTIRAIALLRYAPDLEFALLDLLSTARGSSGGGLGAAMYERVREESIALGAKGLYYECLPDDPALSPNAKTRAHNRARLKFYERFGARVILGTAYETPSTPGTTDSPYLVFDGLDRFRLPSARKLRPIVRALLERKYGESCPPDYIDKVERSIDDRTLRLRLARPAAAAPGREAAPGRGAAAKVPLIVNDRHDIHHVRDRGYVEAPIRISAILGELERSGLFRQIAPRHYANRFIHEVHDRALVDFIERACAEAPLRKSIYPYVFPIRNPNRLPVERSVLAGYWCIDTFTPLNRNAYPAARRAVDCTLTAAELVINGAPIAYALVRPPGHHAERRSFGGFCYFNNAAIAAQFLSRHGRVAVLDIDYHHGNGTQDIFFERADVLTVSVHGHPRFAYPYFTGFRDEIGRGAGTGFNLNLPLPEKITPEQHREAVATALKRIARHAPAFLVLALGLDTAAGDATGSWSNRTADFHALGRQIAAAGLPTVVVQEGGYRIRTLGANVRNFFAGLAEAHTVAAPAPRPMPAEPRTIAVADLAWADTVAEPDIAAVRGIVDGTEMFTAAEAEVAVELVQERINRGSASGYEFVMARSDGRLIGYACYGPTAGTDGRYDLYWIAVSAEVQGKGIGRAILARTEQAIAAAGGVRIYVDTSSTEKYAKTRRFYRRAGFRKLAELRDFYRQGDGKVIYAKEL